MLASLNLSDFDNKDKYRMANTEAHIKARRKYEDKRKQETILLTVRVPIKHKIDANKSLRKLVKALLENEDSNDELLHSSFDRLTEIAEKTEKGVNDGEC